MGYGTNGLTFNTLREANIKRLPLFKPDLLAAETVDHMRMEGSTTGAGEPLAVRAAAHVATQARAHYEPQLAAAKAENERLAKRANKNRWIRIAEAEGRRASGLRSGLDKALNKIRMLERQLERETQRRIAAEQAWQRWIDGHQIEGDYFVTEFGRREE